LLLEGHDALGNGEVFLGSVLSHNKEASGLLVIRVGSALEMVKVLQLGLLFLMESEELSEELSIVAIDLFAVLLQVEDGATLRLNLLDVEVVNACNLVRSLCAFHSFPLFGGPRLHLFLGLAHFVLDAEVEVTALLLPKLLKVLSFGDVEFEVVLLHVQRLLAQFVEQIALEAQLGKSEVSAVLVTPGVDQLELGELLLDLSFDELPIDLELGLGVHLRLVGDNDWVLVVFIDQDHLAVLVVLVLLLFLLLVLRLLLPLFVIISLLFGESLVSSASNCVSLDLELLRLGTSFLDVVLGPPSILHLLAVEEVSNVDVAALVGLDLLPEELVLH